jgi:hypothetical protein
VIVSVPVGVDESELESEATVIVMVSLAPEAGLELAAVSVVEDDAKEDPLVVGHAVSNL